MTDASERDVEDWISAVSQLYHNAVEDPTAEHAADRAVANLWSGFGYLAAPIEVLRMLTQATEIGYATALQDIRDGKLEDELASLRPDLF